MLINLDAWLPFQMRLLLASLTFCDLENGEKRKTRHVETTVDSGILDLRTSLSAQIVQNDVHVCNLLFLIN